MLGSSPDVSGQMGKSALSCVNTLFPLPLDPIGHLDLISWIYHPVSIEEPRVQFLHPRLVFEDVTARAGILGDVLLSDSPDGISGLDNVDLLDEDGVLSVLLRRHASAEDRRSRDDSADCRLP